MPQDDELQKILNQHFPADDGDHNHGDDEATRGGFKWIASLFALLFAAGAVGLMIYGYNWWQKQRVASDADMPVIAGPEEAVKLRPTDPGGMNIPHQDATIYDELNNKPSESAEKTMPAAEEPADESTTILSDGEDNPPLISDVDAAKTVQSKIEEPTALTPKPVEMVAPVTESTKSATATALATAKPTEAKKIEQPAANPTVKEKTKTTPAATPPAIKKTVSSDAIFNIQLAAVRDDAGLADKEWVNIKGRAGALLTGLTTSAPHVQVGDHTMVRLQAGPVTRTDGEALCAKLKAKNQACMLVHR